MKTVKLSWLQKWLWLDWYRENFKQMYRKQIWNSTKILFLGWVPGLQYKKIKQLERLRSGDTPRCPMITHTIDQFIVREREREIKFIGLFESRGHRGPYSPYKPFNHNLYIGIIIFPHIDNPQYTGYDLPKKKPNKMINEKKWGPH